MKPFATVTTNGATHEIPMVSAYPSAGRIGGKDPEWNARKESRREQRQRLSNAHAPYIRAANGNEMKDIVRRQVLAKIGIGHADVVAHLLQVVTHAERKARRAADRARKANTLPAPIVDGEPVGTAADASTGAEAA